MIHRPVVLVWFINKLDLIFTDETAEIEVCKIFQLKIGNPRCSYVYVCICMYVWMDVRHKKTETKNPILAAEPQTSNAILLFPRY